MHYAIMSTIKSDHYSVSMTPSDLQDVAVGAPTRIELLQKRPMFKHSES